ncbi:tetratricopeptide repeat protein [Rheinheimera metallidurans]|uniref:tetratricopeptide repeat protein n=1 Tax=Rheinheimera metallidurans TaxID=2925781 RepID=UPI0030017114
MRLIILSFLLILLPATYAAEPLLVRLAEAKTNSEQVSEQLLAMPVASRSTEDWLVLTETQMRLLNKDSAMDAVNRAIESAQSAYLKAYGYLLKAQVYGILYRDTTIAITQLESAEQLLQHTDDNDSMALYSDVLQSFAQAYNQLGNIPLAIPYAQRSLELALKQLQPDAELKAHITLGRLMLQNNAYSQAYQHLNEALELATRLQDTDALASIHLRLGMAYRKIQYHTQALDHLQQASALYKQLKRTANYTYSLIYIADTYLEDITTADQAMSYLNEALEHARKMDDVLRIGVVTLSLGRLAALQNNADLALTHFNHALQLFSQQQISSYSHETLLALIELLLKQQQYQQANHHLQELAPQMPQAASYLRYRFHDVSAKMAAHDRQWANAYNHSIQASALRFEQLSEQSKLQLDLINQGLYQVTASKTLQAELKQTKQINIEQKQRIKLYIVAIALLVLILAVVFIWVWRRKVLAKKTLTLSTPNWTNFCQRIQLHSVTSDVSILAYALTNSPELKRQHGEQQLQHLWQNFLHQQPSNTLLASCIYDDVLWLAASGDEASVSTLQTSLLQQLKPRLKEISAEQSLLSLHLPLAQLLEKPWRTLEITALREALWSSWALCTNNHNDASEYVMSISSTQPRACEWRGNMVRQDLLNAIRLGSMVLRYNNRVLPATSADNLN